MTDIVRDPYGNPLKRDATITALRAEIERIGRDYQAARDAHDKLLAEVVRLRAALIPFACRCARKGEGAGGTCLAPGGICSWWNARAALEEKQ